MALGDPYAELEQLKKYLLGASEDVAEDTLDDDELTDVLDSVTAEIEDHCGRQFNNEGDAPAASARTFQPRDACLAYVHDFYAVDGLVVATDGDGDGVYETVWSASDYQLEPLDGIVNHRPGWPRWKIRAVGGLRFPVGSRATLRVTTTRWGWATVPAPVHQACLILSAETNKLRTAPFGVAGFGQFGAVRVRDNPIARRKLKPYVYEPMAVG